MTSDDGKDANGVTPPSPKQRDEEHKHFPQKTSLFDRVRSGKARMSTYMNRERQPSKFSRGKKLTSLVLLAGMAAGYAKASWVSLESAFPTNESGYSQTHEVPGIEDWDRLHQLLHGKSLQDVFEEGRSKYEESRPVIETPTLEECVKGICHPARGAYSDESQMYIYPDDFKGIDANTNEVRTDPYSLEKGLDCGEGLATPADRTILTYVDSVEYIPSPLTTEQQARGLIKRLEDRNGNDLGTIITDTSKGMYVVLRNFECDDCPIEQSYEVGFEIVEKGKTVAIVQDTQPIPEETSELVSKRTGTATKNWSFEYIPYEQPPETPIPNLDFLQSATIPDAPVPIGDDTPYAVVKQEDHTVITHTASGKSDHVRMSVHPKGAEQTTVQSGAEDRLSVSVGTRKYTEQNLETTQNFDFWGLIAEYQRNRDNYSVNLGAWTFGGNNYVKNAGTQLTTENASQTGVDFTALGNWAIFYGGGGAGWDGVTSKDNFDREGRSYFGQTRSTFSEVSGEAGFMLGNFLGTHFRAGVAGAHQWNTFSDQDVNKERVPETVTVRRQTCSFNQYGWTAGGRLNFGNAVSIWGEYDDFINMSGACIDPDIPSWGRSLELDAVVNLRGGWGLFFGATPYDNRLVPYTPTFSSQLNGPHKGNKWGFEFGVSFDFSKPKPKPKR